MIRSLQSPSRSFFQRNGLSIVFVGLFLIFLVAQALTGWHDYNNTLREDGAQALSLSFYLTSGHFYQATFENWESEFLQMFLYVLLTISLRQWGSSESKPLDESADVDREPNPTKKDAPWPVRKGGWLLALYKNSLSLAFLLLFLLSWGAHAYGSYKNYAAEETAKVQYATDFIGYLGEAKFWFESFQNWQSEFLAVASIVILSIFLRQKGSPESKPVDASYEEME